MAEDGSRTYVTIRDVWAMVPEVECKGLCQEACTAIGMNEAELALLQERLPSFPGTIEGAERMSADPQHYHCPALVFGKCIVYDVRPTVCRLWGVDERMPCPHGCVPAGGHLKAARGSAIMDAARKVGGEPA